MCKGRQIERVYGDTNRRMHIHSDMTYIYIVIYLNYLGIGFFEDAGCSDALFSLLEAEGSLLL